MRQRQGSKKQEQSSKKRRVTYQSQALKASNVAPKQSSSKRSGSGSRKGKREVQRDQRTIIIENPSVDAEDGDAYGAGEADGAGAIDGWGNMLRVSLSTQSKEPLLGFDPCSSFHLACKEQELINQQVLPSVTVSVASGQKITLSRGGELHTKVYDHKGKERSMIIKGVYRAPNLENINLLSMGLLDTQGYTSATMKGKLALSTNPIGASFTEGIFATGYKDPAANIFIIRTSEEQPGGAYFAAPKTGSAGQTALDASLLHLRLGHCSEKALLRTAETHKIVLVNKNKSPCLVCAESTIQRAPKRANAHLTRSKIPGEGWSLDKFGPLRVAGLDHSRYFLLATDDASLLLKIWLLKNATAEHQLACVKALFAWVLTQTGRRVKSLRTDGEWSSNAFKQLQAEWGFEHLKTNRDTPSSNGIAERMGGIVMAKARAMMIQSRAPPFLYTEALIYAVYIYNRTTRPLHMSPLASFKRSGVELQVQPTSISASQLRNLDHFDPEKLGQL